MKLDVGFVLPKAGAEWSAEKLAAFARRADDLGFHSLWIGDHIVLPTGGTAQYPYSDGGSFPRVIEAPFNEMSATLAYVAAVTKKVRLGSSVSALPYRNAVSQAKWWATLDVLSGGRAICGVGVGYLEPEFAALGVPFASRGAMTDEYLAAFRALWTDPNPEFHGKFCDFAGIQFWPKPLQHPLPIWVGGNTRAAMRRALAFGQGWMIARETPEGAAALVAELRTMAERAGKDAGSITVALKRRLQITDLGLSGKQIHVGRGLVGTTEQVVNDFRRCEALGIRHLLFDFYTGNIDEQITMLEALAPRVLPTIRT